MKETINDDIFYLLLDFTLEQKAFDVKTLIPFTTHDLNLNMLETALNNDPRFIFLSDSARDLKLCITKRSLCIHFIGLTVNLARMRQPRFSETQLADFMNDLRTDGMCWIIPPIEAIDFGIKFGFIGHTINPTEYVSPIAHVLSLTSPTKIEMAVKFLYEIADMDCPEVPAVDLTVKLVEEVLQSYSAKMSCIVTGREGLRAGRKLTLDELGNRFNITRERVRQIEKKFWRIVRLPLNSLPFVSALVYDIAAAHGSLITTSGTPESNLRQFIAKCLNIPYAIFPHTNLHVLGVSPQDMEPFNSRGWCGSEIDEEKIAEQLNLNVKLTLNAEDVKKIAQLIAGNTRKHINRGEKVMLALRSIGRPAHYSEVAEAYKAMFPDDMVTERNVHAILSREVHGIVWIGVRGTFALAEWGYEHPSETLFQTVTDIVKNAYHETGQPVPFRVIVAEIGKFRRVIRPSSLTIAAHCNPDLHRVFKDSFVPRIRSEEVAEELTAKELDKILREFESDKS